MRTLIFLLMIITPLLTIKFQSGYLQLITSQVSPFNTINATYIFQDSLQSFITPQYILALVGYNQYLSNNFAVNVSKVEINTLNLFISIDVLDLTLISFLNYNFLIVDSSSTQISIQNICYEMNVLSQGEGYRQESFYKNHTLLNTSALGLISTLYSLSFISSTDNYEYFKIYNQISDNTLNSIILIDGTNKLNWICFSILIYESNINPKIWLLNYNITTDSKLQDISERMQYFEGLFYGFNQMNRSLEYEQILIIDDLKQNCNQSISSNNSCNHNLTSFYNWAILSVLYISELIVDSPGSLQCSQNKNWSGERCKCNQNYLEYNQTCHFKPGCKSLQLFTMGLSCVECRSELNFVLVEEGQLFVCQCETGTTLTLDLQNPTTPAKCLNSCGDNITNTQQSCDDGNIINSDGCSESCEIEPGYQCTSIQYESSICYLLINATMKYLYTIKKSMSNSAILKFQLEPQNTQIGVSFFNQSLITNIPHNFINATYQPASSIISMEIQYTQSLQNNQYTIEAFFFKESKFFKQQMHTFITIGSNQQLYYYQNNQFAIISSMHTVLSNMSLVIWISVLILTMVACMFDQIMLSLQLLLPVQVVYLSLGFIAKAPMSLLYLNQLKFICGYNIIRSYSISQIFPIPLRFIRMQWQYQFILNVNFIFAGYLVVLIITGIIFAIQKYYFYLLCTVDQHNSIQQKYRQQKHNRISSILQFIVRNIFLFTNIFLLYSVIFSYFIIIDSYSSYWLSQITLPYPTLTQDIYPQFVLVLIIVPYGCIFLNYKSQYISSLNQRSLYLPMYTALHFLFSFILGILFLQDWGLYLVLSYSFILIIIIVLLQPYKSRLNSSIRYLHAIFSQLIIFITISVEICFNWLNLSDQIIMYCVIAIFSWIMIVELILMIILVKIIYEYLLRWNNQSNKKDQSNNENSMKNQMRVYETKMKFTFKNLDDVHERNLKSIKNVELLEEEESGEFHKEESDELTEMKQNDAIYFNVEEEQKQEEGIDDLSKIKNRLKRNWKKVQTKMV